MAPQSLAGKYELQEEIARGGMGVIYKAFHRRLNDTVAIKLIHAHLSQDPSFAERFLREARAMARLRQHEHIVKIYDADEERGTHFLVMEFCPGKNLRTIIKQQAPLHQHHVVQLAEQVASALAYAHAQGVIHRDIKPANVLVDARYNAKLTDFGIAAARGEVALTSADGVIGTAEYMSPEQARGLKLDGRSDLYSLGVIMYEMLTGKTPYGESSGTAILGKLAYDRAELDPQFPGPIHSMVKDVVRDLLRRSPDERISDADSLASQLREILYVLPPAPMPPPSDDSAHTVLVPTPAPPNPPPDATVIAPSPPLGKPQPSGSGTKTVQQPQPSPPWKHPKEPVVQPLNQPRGTLTHPIDPILDTPPSSQPRKLPLGLIVAGGIVLVGIISIIMMSSNGSQPDSTKGEESQQQEAKADEQEQQKDRQRRERITEQLRPYEAAMAQLEPIVRDTAAQLDAAPIPADCQDLKKLLLDTYKEYDHTVVEVNRLRRELGQDPVSPIQPAALDKECPSQRTSPPPQSGPSSSETRLQSLIAQFKQAYEHRNLDRLRTLARMSDARLVNLETMFHNYKTLKLSRPSISQEDTGAVVTLVIETAITTTGESVDLSPIAKKITLRIPRQGDSWDKIVW